MKYFESHSDNRIIAYDTNKQFIDASSEDLFGDFEDHNDGLESTTKGKEKYIESHPSSSHHHFIISDDIDEKIGDSPLKFFLDGSRHVYRTNDLVIAGNVYPVVTGQIVVGCCKREGREIVKHDFKRKIILAVPKQFDYDNQGENFLRKKCEEINAALCLVLK